MEGKFEAIIKTLSWGFHQVVGILTLPCGPPARAEGISGDS